MTNGGLEATARVGGCLCGQVRFMLNAAPVLTALCHCTHCQKQSGSAFSVNLVIESSSLEISGVLSTYEDHGDSGNLLHRQFCASCGSPIVTVPVADPGVLYLKAGTLDDPTVATPELQIWCISAQPWVRLETSIPSFEKNPVA